MIDCEINGFYIGPLIFDHIFIFFIVSSNLIRIGDILCYMHNLEQHV